MSTFTFNNKEIAHVLKYAVICEGRQLSVICHVEAILEDFFQLGHLDLLHTAHSRHQ